MLPSVGRYWQLISPHCDNVGFFKGRHGTQHIDIQHNDIQHNDIQHNDIQHNDIQHNDIQHNDIQHNDIQHNGEIKILMHNATFYCYPACHYDECRYVEWRCAECRGIF
jgi:hypothetical protein